MSNLNDDYITLTSDDDVVYSNINLTNTTADTYTIGSGIGGPYTISSGAIGSGYTWTTGSNGIDWSIGSNIQPNSGKVSIIGPNADIEVNGRSLMGAIDALEQRLNILVPNPELEKEWDELKELGDRYRELEKQCKEKGSMWAKLKEIKK